MYEEEDPHYDIPRRRDSSQGKTALEEIPRCTDGEVAVSEVIRKNETVFGRTPNSAASVRTTILKANARASSIARISASDGPETAEEKAVSY